MADALQGPPLGGRTAAGFLRRYWQRQSLLVKAAVPGFRGVATRAELFRLAGRDDVESRVVVRDARRWTLEHGPFSLARLRRLPARNWTLLVQGVDLHVPAAEALLRRFAFVPYARLDDVMVSYAAPGGGVGPHFDSYDVFLLQAEGRRRWRIGQQRELALKPHLPIKVLQHFRPVSEMILAPGDMLYLPPKFAHEGVALDPCTTCSIGFRAPAAQEVATAFLDWLRDRVAVSGRYADPGTAPAREPAKVPAPLQRHAGRVLASIRWSDADVTSFIGGYLSEPKPGVAFASPPRALSAPEFLRVAARRGVRLHSATRLLYDRRSMYINGEALAWPAGERTRLKRLANERVLAGAAAAAADAGELALLRDWHRHGFLDLA